MVLVCIGCEIIPFIPYLFKKEAGPRSSTDALTVHPKPIPSAATSTDAYGETQQINKQVQRLIFVVGGWDILSQYVTVIFFKSISCVHLLSRTMPTNRLQEMFLTLIHLRPSAEAVVYSSLSKWLCSFPRPSCFVQPKLEWNMFCSVQNKPNNFTHDHHHDHIYISFTYHWSYPNHLGIFWCQTNLIQPVFSFTFLGLALRGIRDHFHFHGRTHLRLSRCLGGLSLIKPVVPWHPMFCFLKQASQTGKEQNWSSMLQ